MKSNYVDNTITTIEMCAGYGGIGLGLKNIFGERLRTIAYCELEGYAQANLISKMEKGLLDAAPIWSDLKTFPYKDFHGLVDILIAGYPCQPFSAAGKRAGKDDPRHLWPWIADGIQLLRPRMCLFENVEGHISLGLSTVISDLEELGYKVAAGLFSASECLDASGRTAPHQRKRIFIMAHLSSERLERYRAIGIEKLHESHSEKFFISGNSKIIWTSRPGEQQFAWEPPRVVANTNHQHGHGEERGGNPEAQGVPSEHWQEEHSRWESGRADAKALEDSKLIGRGGRSDGDERGLRREIQTAGSCGGGAEAMGNAAQLFSDGCDDHARSGERSEEISKSGDASWEAMGNAECIRIPTTREHGAMDEASGIPADREGCESAQADPESSATREREGHGANASECHEIESSMGDPIDGTSSWMGDSKLSTLCDSELAEIREWMVKCDNRTDELRLLGNGVVPATAEKAFLTLIEEINK